MKITIERRYKKDRYTIGLLFIDGRYFCDTLEDKDRGLKSTTDLAEIRKKKVYGETAIPIGSYNVILSKSVKFGSKSWAKKRAGYVPEIQRVPGFEGVRMHPGNWPEDSLGCILPGMNKIKGGVLDSVYTYDRLFDKIKYALDNGEIVILEIK